ncbi:MAG: HEPN domain-containing protein [Oscillospiraceae bacterium]|nr:HEPN domain-containing protein [Oscillospiraceae bacterium]
MTSNNDDLVREWYRFALTDYAAAKHLSETMHPKPLEIICYHCQQSAEKMLKGFLISNSIEAPKTHDLQQLRKMCLNIDCNFETLKGMCTDLNPYGVQPRYPNEIEVFETDVENALRNIQKMIDFFEGQGISVTKP